MILPNTEVERNTLRAALKKQRRARYHRIYRKRGRREQESRFQKWLQGKPAIIRQLANRYPLARVYMLGGVRHWLYGYNESGQLLLSEFDPTKSDWFYQQGCKNIKYVCASDFYREQRR